MSLTAWPADKTERWPIEKLAPYARNTRTHSPDQVAQIAASITEFGWTIPVLVDEAGEIIAGHGRVLAAESLGIAEAPVMVAVGWTEAQKQAYRIADNQLALNAGWDGTLLTAEILTLDQQGFDLSLLGFSGDELSAFLVSPDQMDPTDGKGSDSTADPAPKLKWGNAAGQAVPLSAEEVAMLDEALARHCEIQGVKFGFVRAILGDVRS